MIPDWAKYLGFREAFAEVTDARYYPIEWLDERILEGRARMFATDTAALVVELRLFPGGALDAHTLIAAGDRDEITGPLREQAEEWGRLQGCTAAVVESRPGWAKALKSHGYELSQVTTRKELADGSE